jgi:hypothetical protein
MIKKFIARPVYIGILAKATLETDDKIIQGYGDYEYMIFRT